MRSHLIAAAFVCDPLLTHTSTTITPTPGPTRSYELCKEAAAPFAWGPIKIEYADVFFFCAPWELSQIKDLITDSLSYIYIYMYIE